MSDESTPIDGDKIIEFVRSVKRLGEILDTIDFIEIKDSFLVGRKCKEIDRVIEIQQMWMKGMAGIADGLEKTEQMIMANKREVTAMKHTLGPIMSFMCSSEYRMGLDRLAEFCKLCDQIQKHRESGTLQLVTHLIK